MGWIKWVGGGIAAATIGAAILFGVVVTGGGASAQESGGEPFEPILGFGIGGEDVFRGGEGEVVALAFGPGDEYWELVASKLGVSVDELKTAMEEAREELGLPGPGDRPHRPFRNGAIFGWNLRGGLETASELTGVAVKDIIAAFREGKTLAQIGEENGVSKADLKAAIVAEITEKLDQALANERISQERYDEIVANLGTRVDELLDKVHTGPADTAP
jgi:hypothetical protein